MPFLQGGQSRMEDTPRIVKTRRLRDAWPPISEGRVVLPSGATREWTRLHFGTSAGILPVTGDRRILLTREYGHGLRRIAFSLPGGIVKVGESAEACARRERLQETGHAGARRVPPSCAGRRSAAPRGPRRAPTRSGAWSGYA